MKCVLPQKSPGSSPNVRRKSALKIDTATASARFKAAAATKIEAAASARFNAAAAAAAETTTTTCVSSYGSNATLPNLPTPSASAAAAVSATSSTMARSEPAAATVPNRPLPRFSDERRPSIWEIFEDSLPKITVEKY